MRRLLVILAGIALVASSSTVLSPVGAAPSVTLLGGVPVGCTGAAASFDGQAYCLDGNHFSQLADVSVAGAVSPPSLEQDRQTVGELELNGWQAATRCNGDGTSGKREQVVYVHVQGAPDVYKTARALILQRLIPGANGVFEHSTGGKRAVRWVTRTTATGCIPTIVSVTVAKSANTLGSPFVNIANAVLAATGGERADRSYLVFVDQDEGDCGLGQVRQDSSPGPGNINNTGGAVAMVWPECWTGLTAAHELTHTMGAVQPEAPHHTDLGHCWDGRDAMCYPDGSPQKQQLICTKADDYRKLDCNGDDYFSLHPQAGTYLATHWNSAASAFLIMSRPRLLPTRPGPPASVTVTTVDATHVRVTWQPGVTKRGGVTSWTVLVGALGGEILGDANGLWPYTRSSSQVTVGGNARSALITVAGAATQTFAVYAANASGDGIVSDIVSPVAPPPVL
jgi:hypothetical protein